MDKLKDFLKTLGDPEFSSKHMYHNGGLEVHFSEAAYHAKWVDETLTLYLSDDGDKIVGYKINLYGIIKGT